MKYKTIDDFDLRGKRVLLRSDLNSEVVNGKVVAGPRISESAKTIKELIGEGARVVVMAHQGRKGDDDYTSLEQHAKLLRKYVKVGFVDDVIGTEAVRAIGNLKDGEALLLENVRSLNEEMKPTPNNPMVKALAPLFDVYINDAFSVSHRAHTSIIGFASLMKNGVGRVMQRELEGLERLVVRDALYILAGSKEENVKLMKQGRKILVGGVFGHMCLVASGRDLGAQNEYLKAKFGEKYDTIINELRGKVKGVAMPVDLAVRDEKGKRRDLPLSEFPSEYGVFDIGPVTTERYVNEIKKAKVVLLKGPVGYCEEKQFSEGTEGVLKAMAGSDAFTVLGGGHTNSEVQKLGFKENQFGYISLSGGAFVSYLAGEKLPGLEVLEKK